MAERTQDKATRIAGEMDARDAHGNLVWVRNEDGSWYLNDPSVERLVTLIREKDRDVYDSADVSTILERAVAEGYVSVPSSMPGATRQTARSDFETWWANGECASGSAPRDKIVARMAWDAARSDGGEADGREALDFETWWNESGGVGEFYKRAAQSGWDAALARLRVVGRDAEPTEAQVEAGCRAMIGVLRNIALSERPGETWANDIWATITEESRNEYRRCVREALRATLRASGNEPERP